MTNDRITAMQELYRGNAVVAKAKREGSNIAKALRDHMVGRNIVELLLKDNPEEVEPAKRKKRGGSESAILEWAKDHVGEDTNPAAIADATGLSYATANKIVGLRTDWFQRIKKGHYIVHNPDLEREADRSGA